MNIDSLKRSIAPYYRNLFGWRTNRKIVVIESDDWGSIRMPSRAVYKKCLEAGYRVDLNPYERYDSLASEDDLELLFDVLTSYKDSNGNHPVITANSLVANPDFYKIEESDFQQYHYELITETFKRYSNHTRCFDIWKEGFESGIFHPQSHGREHLNVSKFMNALQSKDRDVHFGFKLKMPGSIPIKNSDPINKYVEALHFEGPVDKADKLSVISEGLNIFEDLFGYRSKSFIPPNYIWSPDFDKKMSEQDVKYYQGIRKMKEVGVDGNTFHVRYLGKQNKYNQIYLTRNTVFEPSLFNMKIKDPVAHCLKSISAAFRMHKPAIISSHRINYAGYVDVSNRDNNLKMLNNLLSKIAGRWPNVEYMSSDDLGDLIMQNNNKL